MNSERPNAGDIVLKPVVFRSNKPTVLTVNHSEGKKGDLVYRAVMGRSNGFYSNNFVLLEDDAGKGIVLFVDKSLDSKEWFALEVVFANKDFGRARVFDSVTKEKLIEYYSKVREGDNELLIEDLL